MGLVIRRISSMLRNPSVIQWRLTMSAFDAFISLAVRLPNLAGERHVLRGDF